MKYFSLVVVITLIAAPLAFANNSADMLDTFADMNIKSSRNYKNLDQDGRTNERKYIYNYNFS